MAKKHEDGSIIRFGNYYKNNETTKEPIEWIVVQAENDKVFVITKDIIECKTFDDKGSKIWKDSSLRSWLNNDFLKIAFTESERNDIPDVNLNTTVDGNETSTTDKVFILASDEIEGWLEGKWNKAKPTPYAILKGCEPLEEEGFFTQGCKGTASYFHRDSTLEMSAALGGLAVHYTSLSGEPSIVSEGIRPCMYIMMDNAIYNPQLTEAVRRWFFADQGRIAMVQMVTRMPKMMGAKLDPEDELVMIVNKLKKETYWEQIVPREKMDDVDFVSIAKRFME